MSDLFIVGFPTRRLIYSISDGWYKIHENDMLWRNDASTFKGGWSNSHISKLFDQTTNRQKVYDFKYHQLYSG